jgi:hypothetical protein
MNALTIAASLAVSTFTAHHSDELCEKIRSVRQVAVQQRMDDRTLAQLEGQYCVAPTPPPPAPPPAPAPVPTPPPGQGTWPPQQPLAGDCLDLTTMIRLASMSGANREMVRMMESQRNASCAFGDSKGSFYWPNGNTAKNGYAWYYPNGNTAKNSYALYYPNGNTMKNSYALYYPNGNTAKNSYSWYAPNGNSATIQSLVAMACGERERGDGCYREAMRLKSLPDNERDIALMELVWRSTR